MVLRLLVILLGVGLGCQRDAPKAPPAAPVTLDPLPPAPPAPAPMLPKRVEREILVGGCLEHCETPAGAMRGFLEAVMAQDVDRVRSFVNTAALVHDGERLGDRWADLFTQGQLGIRRLSIDEHLKGWLAWPDRLVNPADRGNPTVGVSMVEQNQRRIVVDYRRPDLTPAPGRPPSAAVWRLEWRPRGLEWLVTVIDTRPPTR